MEVKTESSEKLQLVKEMYQEAEDAIKIVEHAHNKGMITPAINELRYAGNHILKGLSAENDEQQTEEFVRAERHCQRAIYDAIEVGALDCFAVFDVFQDDYRLVEVAKICPDYHDILDIVEGARKFVRNAQKSEKEQFYKELQERYQQLKDATDKLERRRPQINIAMTKRRRRGYVLVSGLLVALLTLFATVYFGLKSPKVMASSSILDVCMTEALKVNPDIKLKETLRKCQTPVTTESKQHQQK